MLSLYHDWVPEGHPWCDHIDPALPMSRTIWNFPDSSFPVKPLAEFSRNRCFRGVEETLSKYIGNLKAKNCGFSALVVFCAAFLDASCWNSLTYSTTRSYKFGIYLHVVFFASSRREYVRRLKGIYSNILHTVVNDSLMLTSSSLSRSLSNWDVRRPRGAASNTIQRRGGRVRFSFGLLVLPPPL